MAHETSLRLRFWLIWPVIGLVLWGIFYLNDSLARVPTHSLNLLGLAMGCALLWALVTPVIRKLARRWPLDEALRIRVLLLHLGFSLVFSFLMSCVMVGHSRLNRCQSRWRGGTSNSNSARLLQTSQNRQTPQFTVMC